MYQAYALSCMLCNRTVAHVYLGRWSLPMGQQAVQVRGQQLRCGYCEGTLYLEGDLDPVQLGGPDELPAKPAPRRQRLA